MSLDFPICERCGGYEIYGTYRAVARTLSSRCKCLPREEEEYLRSVIERDLLFTLDMMEMTRHHIAEAAILALAEATGTAKTPQAVECEASQSGPKGNAQKASQ